MLSKLFLKWIIGALVISSSDSFTPSAELSRLRRPTSFLAANPLQAFLDQASEQLMSLTKQQASNPRKDTTATQYDDDIAAAKAVLLRASETKAEDGGAVVDALLDLEKLQRAKARVSETVAADTIANLDGAWRLVFTTGTLDTQKKIKGRINYCEW